MITAPFSTVTTCKSAMWISLATTARSDEVINTRILKHLFLLILYSEAAALMTVCRQYACAQPCGKENNPPIHRSYIFIRILSSLL